MTSRTDLWSNHRSDWAVFLPAMSSFYISGMGKQKTAGNYFAAERMPAQIPDSWQLNFLDQQALYYYSHCLYSAGHADLDISNPSANDLVIRNRDRANTFVLGDSGGFQIFTGQWPADWKDPACARAAAKRQEVLQWLESYSDYAMILDVPSRIALNPDMGPITGIYTYDDAVQGTHINNEYFIKHRTPGKCRFLNVLQGGNHAESEHWYQEMKRYCDPRLYPDRHFEGWAAGGMNVQDIEQILKRLVTMIHDGMLEQGLHDWIHYLGTSWLEYAVMFTAIQRAIRKNHNPNFTISYDCASPFYGAAKGQMYYENRHRPGEKWSYKMQSTAEDKRFAGDTRPFSQAVIAEGIHATFVDSPVTERMTLGDLCYRGVGAVSKHGKETKTSWDTLSYVLVQSHNVWMHITAVQEANRQYERGVFPKMLVDDRFDYVYATEIVDQVFAAHDFDRSMQIIEDNRRLWRKFRGGAANSDTYFNQLFQVTDTVADSGDQAFQELDTDAAMADLHLED